MTPRVSLICAVSANGVIGRNNQLPWKLPADLRRFKKLTMNHPLLMGRKTYESIGKALPGRTNIIVTRQKDFQAPGCVVVRSLEEAFGHCPKGEEAFVIGGAELFGHALKFAEKIYLTRLRQDFQGDAFLFEMDPKIWKETSREEFAPDEQNPCPYSFLTYEKKGSC